MSQNKTEIGLGSYVTNKFNGLSGVIIGSEEQYNPDRNLTTEFWVVQYTNRDTEVKYPKKDCSLILTNSKTRPLVGSEYCA